MIEESMLERTMAGLDMGLCVRNITTYDLETCDVDAEIGDVLSDPRTQSFDCLPVRANGVIVGCVWRSAGLVGAAREHMQPITEGLLVSADLPLTQFIPMIADAPQRLVLDGASICGIVTWSDLQKLPVRLFVFTLITYLEIIMAQTILTRFTSEEEWFQLIAQWRRQHIEETRRALQRKNLEPPLIELTSFADKRVILTKRFELGEQFVSDLKAIEALRHTTAHAGSYAESPEAVHGFVRSLQDAEHWIDYFARLDTAPGAEPSAHI